MVAAHNVGVDFSRHNVREQAVGHYEIVDAPTGILLTGTESV